MFLVSVIFTVTIISCALSGNEKAIPQIQPFVFPENMLSKQKASLTCSLLAGSPPLRFNWLKDGKGIQSEFTKIQQLEDVSLLSISSISAEDAGNYTCIVTNDYGSDRHTAILTVKVPAHWVYVPEDQTLLEGGTTVIFCQAEGSPLPKIYWHKEEIPNVSVQLNATYTSGRSEITLINVNKRHEGQYTCIASNGLGSDLRKSFSIKVHEGPHIQPFAFPEDIVLGSKTLATCFAIRGSLPLKFQWLKNGMELRPINNVKIQQIQEDTSMLTINPVEASNSGNYTCTVSNDVETSRRTATLNVRVAPQWLLKPLDQTVLLGNAFQVQCIADGNPVPNITWYRQDSAAEWARINSSPGITTQLTFPSTQRSDQGQYACIASSGLGTEIRAPFSVNVYDPPAVQPFVFPQSVLSNDRVTTTCAVKSGSSPFQFSWQKDGQSLSTGHQGLKIVLLDEESVLKVESARPKHSGNYTCTVRNSAGQASFTATLTVAAPPTWRTKPTNQKEESGHSVQFVCQADGHPEPKISWIVKKGESVTDVLPGPKTLISLEGRLTLLDLTKADEAIYECHVSNGLGSNLTSSAMLQVAVPAKFEEKFYVQTVRRSDSASLQCDARGDSPLQVTWAKDKRPLDTAESKRYEIFETSSLDGVLAELIIRSVERSDGTLYSCTARNEFGSDERNVKLVVEEVPAQPLDVRTQEVWSTSATVSWSAPFTGNSPITSYIVQYWRNKEGPHRLMEEVLPATQSLATLKDLHPGTSYAVTVMALNVVGQGEPSAAIFFTTGEEAPSGPPTDVSAEPKGAHSVLVKWKPPPREHWKGHLKGYYVGYKTDQSNLFSYKSVERPADDHHQYLLTGLTRSTHYIINVKAFNLAGSGPPSHEIRVKTLDGELPKTPAMTLVSASPSSISVRWVQATRKDNVTGFTIHYKKDLSHWHHVPVTTPDLTSYMLTGLESGMLYKVYVTANNRYGRSEPSHILSVRTEDSEVMQALPFYLDLSVVIPVAAIFLAVFVVVIVIIVYLKKSNARRGLEKALQTGKPYTYVPSSSQRYIDLDCSKPPGRPVSYPDPGTPAASVASYATIPASREEPMDDADPRTQEMKTFANQSPKTQSLCQTPPRPSSLKRANHQSETTH